MKKLFVFMFTILFICVTSVTFFGCSPSEPLESNQADPNDLDPNNLLIMSYNIKTVMVDAEIKKTELAISNRNPRILDNIISIMPDVFGLQEAIEVQTVFLEENFSDIYDGVVTYRSEPGKLPLAEAASVYYKNEKFELLDSGTFWLSETPDVMSKGWDANNYRICTYVKLKIKENGKIFNFYNTHLDFGAISVPESVALILSRVDFSCPCILVGDFNFQSNTVHYQAINELMDDSRYIAEHTTDAGTINSFNPELPTKIIDHLFLSKGDFTADSFTVVDDDLERYGYYASDHFPVYANISLIG